MSISWYMDSKMVIHMKVTNVDASVFSEVYPDIVSLINHARDNSYVDEKQTDLGL